MNLMFEVSKHSSNMKYSQIEEWNIHFLKVKCNLIICILRSFLLKAYYLGKCLNYCHLPMNSQLALQRLTLQLS